MKHKWGLGLSAVMLVKIAVLAVDMPEYVNVPGTSFQWKRNRQRITVSSREEAVFHDEIKRRAFLQHCLLFVYDDCHVLRDFGVLLRISFSYSSCACLMPVSPVTLLTVRNGSSRRSRSSRIVSVSPLSEGASGTFCTITCCGTDCERTAEFASTAGAVIDEDTSAAESEPMVFVRCA